MATKPKADTESIDVIELEPKFPAGTPEYEVYAAELRAELDKFARSEEPYAGPMFYVATLDGDAIMSGRLPTIPVG
jgi:hypothetical protein